MTLESYLLSFSSRPQYKKARTESWWQCLKSLHFRLNFANSCPKHAKCFVRWFHSFVLLPLMKSGSITVALTHGKIFHHNALTLEVTIIDALQK